MATLDEDGADVSIGDISVTVPSEAAPIGTKLIIEAAMPKDAAVGELDDELFELATAMYDFSLSTGDQPAAPIRLSYPIPEEIAPEHLAFVTLNSQTGHWEGIPVTVENGVATVALEHFSWGGFLIAKQIWDVVMGFTQNVLLGISDAPECYRQPLTLDGVVYSASSSSILFHPCIEESDGRAELRIFNSGPYTWTLQTDEDLGTLLPPVQSPGTGLALGDRAITLLTRAIFTASNGSAAQLSPSAAMPLTIAASEGTYGVAVEMDAGLSTLYMTLGAAIDLFGGQALDSIAEDAIDGYAVMQCIYGITVVTQDIEELSEILNCLGPAMTFGNVTEKVAKKLSLGLAIFASFGPKVTQMAVGAYASLKGDAQGIVEVSVSPSASKNPAPAQDLPALTLFPGCEAISSCIYTDSQRIDHPTRGELLLALVARSEDGSSLTNREAEDFGAAGALFVVDTSGRVTDLYGDDPSTLFAEVLDPAGASARTGGGTELERISWRSIFYAGSSTPSDEFHFHAPAIDAGGNILIASPGRMGVAAVALRIDTGGYFTAPEVVSMYTSGLVDWATVPDGAAPPTDYYAAHWGDVDSAGLATIELVSQGDEFSSYETRTPLRRDGGAWVYGG